MGVDRTLYYNGKAIACLGRACRFRHLLDDEEIVLFKLHLVANMKWSEDEEKRYDEVAEWNIMIKDFLEDVINRGASELIDEIVLDGGVSYVDE